MACAQTLTRHMMPAMISMAMRTTFTSQPASVQSCLFVSMCRRAVPSRLGPSHKDSSAPPLRHHQAQQLSPVSSAVPGQRFGDTLTRRMRCHDSMMRLRSRRVVSFCVLFVSQTSQRIIAQSQTHQHLRLSSSSRKHIISFDAALSCCMLALVHRQCL